MGLTFSLATHHLTESRSNDTTMGQNETGVDTGGVFDAGVTDVFVHKMPASRPTAKDLASLKEVVLKWYAKASAHYYGA
jgi:hypothetical protein